MKVGAYGSTWLGIHMDPESAVRAHGELGARTLLPVHWATFNLAYHEWAEPIERAVGAANGQNPLALVWPCHRIIGADGSLTGYAGGLLRKRWLLAFEQPLMQGGLFG